MKIFHGTTVPSVLSFFDGLPRFLAQNGCVVAVWSSPGPELDRYADTERCEAYSVVMLREISPFRDIVACIRLIRLFRRTRPDIVHAHTPKAGLLGMLAARIAGVPVRIYHIHGFPYMTAKGWRRLLLLSTERASVRLSNKVFAVGAGMRHVAIEEKICPANKVQVLHNGTAGGIDAAKRFCPELISPQVVADLRVRLNLPNDAKVVGFVGRLARDKGIVELVDAWRLLAANDPSLHLVLVGGVDARDGVPGCVIDEWRSTPHIHLAGHIEEVAPWYLLFDLLALPTYREGYGNVLLEAAAMRVPVVASRIPGCSDAVIDGVTGFLFELRNTEELAKTMGRYLADPELRRQHGENGRRRVLRDFVPTDVFHCMLEEYKKLVEATQ
jgi:glycosyltransferase involved in cell wall biosynthesis